MLNFNHIKFGYTFKARYSLYQLRRQLNCGRDSRVRTRKFESLARRVFVSYKHDISLHVNDKRILTFNNWIIPGFVVLVSRDENNQIHIVMRVYNNTDKQDVLFMFSESVNTKFVDNLAFRV